MIVTDETGALWEVARGDPGWPAIETLKAKGFREPVLPAAYLIHGARPAEGPWPTQQGAVALTNAVRAGTREPNEALRYLACLDCLAACEEIISVVE